MYMECHYSKHLYGILQGESTLTAQNLPRLWKRFVDNIFVVQDTEHKENFLQLINIGSAIKFTVEDTRFCAIPEHAGYTRTQWNTNRKHYRKPIHTDQYLQWDSHKHIGDKYSVIDTLIHWAKTVPSIPVLLRTE